MLALIPLLPFVGFLVNAFGGRRNGKGVSASAACGAMIASFAMALRYSLDQGKLADQIDAAIAAVLARGLRTADIKSDGTTVVSTQSMGKAIRDELEKLAA